MQNLGAGYAIGLSSPRKDDGRTCRRDHKHFLDRMVSDVHGEDRAGPEPLGLHLHLFDSEHFAFSETFLVGARAAAHNIGNPSEKISDEIRSENRLTPDEAKVFLHLLAIQNRATDDQHVCPPPVFP